MLFLDKLASAIGPILPGLTAAAIFIVLILVVRFVFRGQSISERLKTPASLLYVYLLLFSLSVLSRVYWGAFYRMLYLSSLFILALGIILALSVGVFDLFMGRYRQVQVPAIVKDIVVIIVYVVVIIITLGNAGVDLTSIITTSAVLTAIIGFALQDLLSSVIAGLAIQFEHPFRVGHWVQFNEQVGKVLEINWRSTKIETLHRDIVVIPNNVITRAPIINFSVPTTLHRRKLSIGLRYEAAPNLVKRAILKALEGVEGVLKDPAPYVLLREYADFSIVYRIFFFIDDFTRREFIESNALSRVWYQLKRDGLSIPFPIRDINVRNITEESDMREQKHRIDVIMDALKRVPFLEPLNAGELGALARNIKTEFYTDGEEVIRQGQPGSSFYIIASGEVEVRVRDEQNECQRLISVLGPNSFFGERSLMTGEQRSATIVSKADSEFYVIDKAAFQAVISSNQELVGAISEKLIERQTELEKTRTEIKEQAHKVVVEDQETLIGKIRRFFQL